MKNLLLIPLSIIYMSSCSSALTSENSDTDPVSVGAYTYLALGDSYTIGESVAEEDRYPNQLAESLKKAGKDIGKPVIIARTGWTTDELQRAITASGIEGQQYDLVSLLIGVNNEFRGRSVEEYEQQFAELLDQAIAFAKGKAEHVFVVSIPDYGFTPYGKSRQSSISARIDLFNNAAQKIAQAKKVAFYNITPISRKGLQDSELVAEDGLHPSGKQYKAWTDLIARDVLKQLGK